MCSKALLCPPNCVKMISELLFLIQLVVLSSVESSPWLIKNYASDQVATAIWFTSEGGYGLEILDNVPDDKQYWRVEVQSEEDEWGYIVADFNTTLVKRHSLNLL